MSPSEEFLCLDVPSTLCPHPAQTLMTGAVAAPITWASSSISTYHVATRVVLLKDFILSNVKCLQLFPIPFWSRLDP